MYICKIHIYRIIAPQKQHYVKRKIMAFMLNMENHMKRKVPAILKHLNLN